MEYYSAIKLMINNMAESKKYYSEWNKLDTKSTYWMIELIYNSAT